MEMVERLADMERFHGERIIVVDDNAMNLNVLKILLRDQGLSVEVFDRAEEAIKRYISMPAGTYRLVLMDLHMAGMDGFTAARKIRESGKPDSDLPVYALSADMAADSEEKVIEAGMDGYIEKPVDYYELFQLFHNVFAETVDKHGYLQKEETNVPDLIQIQEHFLFNALNTIKGASILRKVETIDLLDQFAVYLRYQFRVLREQCFQPLDQEVKMVKAYAELEMARYPAIKIQIEMEECKLKIPPMSLQMLLSDAVYHYLAAKEQGEILLTGHQTEAEYVIEVWEDMLVVAETKEHPHGSKSIDNYLFLQYYMVEKMGAEIAYLQRMAGRQRTIVNLPLYGQKRSE